MQNNIENTKDWIANKIIPAYTSFTPINILGKEFRIATITESNGYTCIALMENRVMDVVITGSIKI